MDLHRRLERHGLWQLTRARMMGFLREPEAVFRVFVFPILLALALGIAFRVQKPQPLPVGVAPEAKWIDCRNMDAGVGRPSTYIECNQWFLAPWPHGGDPEIDGAPTDAPAHPAGRIRNTRKMLTAAAVIMSVCLIASSLVTTMLIPNLPDPPSALPELLKTDVVQTLERHRVLNARELRARYEVMLEAYNKTINVEGQLMVLMATRYILPVAQAYQTEVAQNVAAVKAARASNGAGKKTLATLSKLLDTFRKRTDALQAALEHSSRSAEQHAKHCRDRIVTLMNALREAGDAIEVQMPSDTWPLPTYREMLFIK